MKKRILIGSLSGRNFAIPTAKMNHSEIVLVNCFSKTLHTEKKQFLLKQKYYLLYVLEDKLSETKRESQIFERIKQIFQTDRSKRLTFKARFSNRSPKAFKDGAY